ncbi:hypothetical protein FI667_g2311, partial [Globisporangium splendens]
MERPAPMKRAASTLSGSSSSSLADNFSSLRQFFTRSASQPSHHGSDGSEQLPAAQAATLSPEDSAAQAFGSCMQVLATVITALFRAINEYAYYEDPSIGDVTIDATTTRKAKLLYVQLLDMAQKERGEWQGFAEEPYTNNTTGDDDNDEPNSQSVPVQRESAMDILTKSLVDLSREDTFAVLHELLEVSFKSIRGPLIAAEIYTRYKKRVAMFSLDIPVSLSALLEIRAILNELGHEHKLCVFRLLALWHAMAVANERHDLSRLIEEKHSVVFSECSELEFLTTRKFPRHDGVAAALLHILVLYHDVLFSDVEFLLVKQELQLHPALRKKSPDHYDDTPSVAPEAPAPVEQDSNTPLVAPEPPPTSIEQVSDGTARPDTREEVAQETVDADTNQETELAQEPDPGPNELPELEVRSPEIIEPDVPAVNEIRREVMAHEVTAHEVTAHEAAAQLEVRDSEITKPEVLAAAETTREGKTDETAAAAAVVEARSIQTTREKSPDREASVHHFAPVSPHVRHGVPPGHGPIVSLRPHPVSPRKTKPKKARSPFNTLTVSTVPSRENRTRQCRKDGEELSIEDAAHSPQHASVPAGSGTQQGSSKGLHKSQSRDKMQRVQASAHGECGPSGKELLETTRRDHVNSVEAHPVDAPTPSTTVTHAKKPATATPEITDLANTYFSFSFAATTLCTMVTMVLYAIRRHHHHHR